MKGLIISLLLFVISVTVGLDNGIALTPPMGWLTWERYRCIIDCEKRPDECISEKLILKVADLLVSEGYLAAGYEYVGIDDCWLEMSRDEEGRLVPDRERFPNGMKYVGDYLHKKGLKFGIYQDYGTKTCEGYPGILGHMETDAKIFGEWGADYVKLDGCYSDPKTMDEGMDCSLICTMDEGYSEFGRLLNETGRAMLYSCSWPYYQQIIGMKPDFETIIKHCNMWRNYDDIQDSWGSVKSITDYFGRNSKLLATYAGPGHWNDPDMLIIGNYGLSYDQSKIQMAVWAILAAPLLMSNDLKSIRPEFKEILLNKNIIAVNQDPLGKAGILLYKRNNVEVWRREVMPLIAGQPSLVFAIVNQNIDGAPRDVILNFAELGIADADNHKITDLFSPESKNWKIIENKYMEKSKNITVRVNPTGVQMYKIEVEV